MSLFGKKKPEPEQPKSPLAHVVIPEGATVVILGLDGVVPFVKTATPCSVYQLALLHSYLGAIINSKWAESSVAAEPNAKPDDLPPES